MQKMMMEKKLSRQRRKRSEIKRVRGRIKIEMLTSLTRMKMLLPTWRVEKKMKKPNQRRHLMLSRSSRPRRYRSDQQPRFR